MTFSDPIIFVPAFCLLGALVAIAFSIYSSRWLFRLLLGALGLLLLLPAAIVFLASHPELIDARFRTYKAFYADIQEGMTRDQVITLMARHYPESGPRKAPKVMEDTAERLGFFMNAEHTFEPNCEGIFLSLRDGRVTRKDYLRD